MFSQVSTNYTYIVLMSFAYLRVDKLRRYGMQIEKLIRQTGIDIQTNAISISYCYSLSLLSAQNVGLCGNTEYVTSTGELFMSRVIFLSTRNTD